MERKGRLALIPALAPSEEAEDSVDGEYGVTAICGGFNRSTQQPADIAR